MTQTKKVRVPTGTTQAAVGTAQYTPDADGVITAPDYDADALLAISGFTEDLADPPPAGFVRVAAPAGETHDGTGTLSYGGVTYTIGADGNVIVPAEAAADLLSHGFTPSVVVPGVVLTDEDAAPPVDPDPATPPAE